MQVDRWMYTVKAGNLLIAAVATLAITGSVPLGTDAKADDICLGSAKYVTLWAAVLKNPGTTPDTIQQTSAQAQAGGISEAFAAAQTLVPTNPGASAADIGAAYYVGCEAKYGTQ
jgi:hypothetical protein